MIAVPQTFLASQVPDPRDHATHRFGLTPAMCARLADAAVWVTGAGTGFGRAVSVSLSLLGATVILSGRRRAVLEAAAADAVRLGAPADRLIVLPVDVRDDRSVDAAKPVLRAAAVTSLVHCAAVAPPRESEWPLLEGRGLPATLATNLEGAWRAGRMAADVSAPRGTMRMVFFSSGAGWYFDAGYGPYNVSKAGLNSLSASLAAEAVARHPQHDIQVNALDPGVARSEMNQGSDRSPFTAVPMTLALLAHDRGGPNGRFFHADGGHLPFASATPWAQPLLPVPEDQPPRLVATLDGYNVIACRGAFVALPQAAGHVDLSIATALPTGAVRAPSLTEIENALLERRSAHVRDPRC